MLVDLIQKCVKRSERDPVHERLLVYLIQGLASVRTPNSNSRWVDMLGEEALRFLLQQWESRPLESSDALLVQLLDNILPPPELYTLDDALIHAPTPSGPLPSRLVERAAVLEHR